MNRIPDDLRLDKSTILYTGDIVHHKMWNVSSWGKETTSLWIAFSNICLFNKSIIVEYTIEKRIKFSYFIKSDIDTNERELLLEDRFLSKRGIRTFRQMSLA